MKIELVRPAVVYRDTFLRGLAELRAEGLPWYLGPEYDGVAEDFAGFVAKRLADAIAHEDGPIPKTQLWAIADSCFVGRIGIHHALSDALRIEGGHIGYDTVPSWRGRGVATEMLRQALPVARDLGLEEVLLTCNATNVPSIRVIEANGGGLVATRTLDPTKAPKRYYRIALR